MKIQDTSKQYTRYYGAPIGDNPLYKEKPKPEKIEKEKKVEPVEKGKSIDLCV